MSKVSMNLPEGVVDQVDALTLLGYTRQGPLGHRANYALWWLLERVRELDPEMDRALTALIEQRREYLTNRPTAELGPTLNGRRRVLRLVSGGGS